MLERGQKVYIVGTVAQIHVDDARPVEHHAVSIHAADGQQFQTNVRNVIAVPEAEPPALARKTSKSRGKD